MPDLSSAKKASPLEIERKFLIVCPPQAFLEEHLAQSSEIIQAYCTAEDGSPFRIRRRSYRNADGSICRVEYIKTVKQKISNIKRIENESVISAEEFSFFRIHCLEEGTHEIQKVRYCLPYRGQCCEIDIYSFWKEYATMEIELPAEDAEIFIPPFLTLIREVTDEAPFTNHSMAKEIPLIK